MPVNPLSHVPIYEQIMEHICTLVAAGVYRPGEPLPSVRSLAADLVVNPNTVQRAYMELQRSDLVRKRKGLGVFVAENGTTSAQKKTETAMYGRFTDGIRLGRATSLGVQRIRAVFGRAMSDVKDAAADNVGAQPQGDS